MGAERAHVVLLDVAAAAIVRIAHLCAAGDAKAVVRLLPPQTHHQHRLPLLEGRVVEGDGTGQNVVLVELELPRDRIGTDRIGAIDRQQRPQAPLAVHPGLPQQEVGSMGGDEVRQVVAVAHLHVAVQLVRIKEQSCGLQPRRVNHVARQLGADLHRQLEQVGEVARGARRAIGQAGDGATRSDEGLHLALPVSRSVRVGVGERDRRETFAGAHAAAVVRHVLQGVAGPHLEEVPRAPVAGTLVVGLSEAADTACALVDVAHLEGTHGPIAQDQVVARRQGVAGIVGESRIGRRRRDHHAAAAADPASKDDRHRLSDRRHLLLAAQVLRDDRAGVEEWWLSLGSSSEGSHQKLIPIPIRLVVSVRGGN